MKINSRLFRLGLKRRKKEVRRMRLMICIAVFFLAFPFLFQDNMNGYQMSVNYHTFGQWIAYSESGVFADDPYLNENGYIIRGSKVYSIKPRSTEFREDGLMKNSDAWDLTQEDNSEPAESRNTSRPDPSHDTGAYLGALSPGMSENNYIEIIDGRFPEKDDEIAMELSVLDSLGQGNEIGSEISFYISRFDDIGILQFLKEESKKNVSAILAGEEYVPDNDIVYDYDLVKIPGRNEQYLVKFKLVGTIQRFSSRWNSDMKNGKKGELPGAVVTPESLEKLEMSNRRFRFYDLKNEYKTQKVWQFAGELMDSLESSEKYENKSFALNRNAYYNPLWGNESMYKSITVLLIVISSCMIAYLMANYLGKRRRFFLTMREIGASTADVWKMAVYECIGSVLPVAGLTFVGAYLLSFITVFIISKILSIEFFYVFSFKTMATILLAALLTIGISMLAALVIFGGRSLVAKSKKLSPAAVKRLKKRSARTHGRMLGVSETLKRDRITYRFKNRLISAISILVCAVVIFCMVKTYQPTKDYIEFENSVCDFIGEKVSGLRDVDIFVPIKSTWNGHYWTNHMREKWTREGFSSINTIPVDAAAFINSLSGVRSIDLRCNDFTHMITFEGKDEDPFFSVYLETFLANNQPFNGTYELDLSLNFAQRFINAMERDFYGIYCKRNAEEYWKKYEAYLDPDVADFEAYMRGEQVIAVVDTDMTRAQQSRDYGIDYDYEYGTAPVIPEYGTYCEDGWYGYKQSFSAGDELTVLCRYDNNVNVTVAGIVPLSLSGLDYEDERFLTLFGAGTFMQRICDADNDNIYFSPSEKNVRYNYFEADLDAIYANEGCVIDLVNICAKNNIRYENNIVPKAEKRETMIGSVVTYGFFGLMLAVLFFFIISCIARDDEVRLGDKYIILSRFGTSISHMKKRKRTDALQRTILLLFALPAAILLIIISNYGVDIEKIRSAKDSVIRTLWNDSCPKIALSVTGIFMFIYWLIISRMDKEWIRNGEKSS